MSTITTGDLTIIRHEQTDGTISVYRGDRHLGMIYPLLGWEAVPSGDREGRRCHDEASALAYLTAGA